MRINRKAAGAGSLLVLAAAAAWACGPFFPSQLLDDRGGTLRATPTNSFAYEAQHLVKAVDALKAVEASPWASAETDPAAPSAEESAGLTPEQVGTLRTMRAAADGDAAWKAGEGLPEAVRLYTTGAVIYRAADPWCGARAAVLDNYGEPAPEPPPCDYDAAPELAKAAARFQAILDLPSKQGAMRSVWAAYMLGQVHAAQAVASPAELEAARKAFALARQLAAAGAPDPAGLAVASWGEEARLYLTAGGCSWVDFYDKAGCIPKMKLADLKHMTALYAEQAARGSGIGVRSLMMIANWSLREPARARAMAEDPLVRRLMVSYALARLGDEVGADPNSSEGWTASENATGASGIVDAARGTPTVTVDPRLVTLVQIVESQPGPVEGADRLAALAYRTGRYDLAVRFAAAVDTPMANWVKAKLALRAGDMAGAAAAYAKASASFPETPDGLEPASKRLVKGEQGVLSLARGEYEQALLALYQAAVDETAPYPEGWNESPGEPGYASDAAYVAERVLTADELKRFVDAHVAASPAVKQLPADDAEGWRTRAYVPFADTLRYLLGRRLLRERRYEAALAYFPEAGDKRFRDPDARDHARRFGEAATDAASASGVSRAQALYAAAAIARFHGMEILGYEQGPDFADSGGTFGWGSGRSTPDWTYPPTPRPPTPEARAALDLPGPYVTDAERKRYAGTEAKPDRRYHYRYVASRMANEAADLLPERSQAFAAVLCKNALWLGNREEAAEDRAAVYKRYLNHGAWVPWGAQFGQACPEPEFGRARWFWLWKPWNAASIWIGYHWYVAGIVAASVAAIGIALLLARRRRRGGPA